MSCKCKQVLIISILFILILAFAPGIPPHIAFTPYEYEDTLPLTGALAPNHVLDGVEHLYEGHLHGPESIVSRRDDEIFVGLHNGDLVKIFGNNFDSLQVVYPGNPCKLWEEAKCGRPLGLRFAADGKLILTDAYLGLLEVDVDTGKKRLLVDSSLPIDGTTPKIPNDLDVDAEGNIYWSDSSTHAPLDNSLLELLGSPSGRLLKYDPKTKKNEVILKDLHFANGVQLSPDGSFILVNECLRFRVIRYWLKGPRKGNSEVFIAGLPGLPDNIRARPEGGYYLALFSSNQSGQSKIKMVSKFPTLRKVVARLLTLIGRGIESLNLLLDSELLYWMRYKLFHLSTHSSFGDHSIAIIVVGEDGKIIDSYQGSSDKIAFTSQATPVGDFLFLGSPYNKYLARIPLRDLEKTKYDSDTKSSTSKDEL